MLVGLHPAVLLCLTSNFIRKKYLDCSEVWLKKKSNSTVIKFSYRGILHFDRRQYIIMPDILKKKLFVDIGFAIDNIGMTSQSVATKKNPPFWRWKHCMATIIYSVIRSCFSFLMNYFFKRTVFNLKQLSKFIKLYYIQWHVIKKTKKKQREYFSTSFFVYFFVSWSFSTLLHRRSYAKALHIWNSSWNLNEDNQWKGNFL